MERTTITPTGSASLLTSFDPHACLCDIGNQTEEWRVDIWSGALALSALQRPNVRLERCFAHLGRIAERTATIFAAEEKAGRGGPDAALTALRGAVYRENGYAAAQTPSADIYQETDLVHVIDRRCGLPEALAVILIGAGRAQGWKIGGLDFPGHYLVRLDWDGRRILLDPAQGARQMEARDLRAILKKHAGKDAELSSAYYDMSPPRATLVHLQNLIKFRLIADEDYAGALECVERMLLFAPRENRLFLDSGVLNARLGRIDPAKEALTTYISNARNPQDRAEAQALLLSLNWER